MLQVFGILREQLKILKTVVASLAVFVVDNLFRLKEPAYVCLDD